MATALQICNSALIRLGAKTISALTGLTTKEYDLCVALYPRLRNTLLKSHTWAFAKVVDDALTTVAADALTEVWSYKHTIPTAVPVGKILAFSDADDVACNYEVVGAYIFSNESDPRLRYVRTYTAVDDGVTFPDDFGEALASILAANMCVSLTQNQSLRQTYLLEYKEAIAQARYNGIIENYVFKVGDSIDWIAAHGGMSGPLDPTERHTGGEEALLLEP